MADGDWGWFHDNMDENGENFVILSIPETPDEFYFKIFGLLHDTSVTVLPHILISTVRPLDFYCEAPLKIKRYSFRIIFCFRYYFNCYPVIFCNYVLEVKVLESYAIS